MAILLLRHGETALNAARVMQPADTALSERGRWQAEALAQRLAPNADRPPGARRISAVLSSDLPRAWFTALPIGQRCGVPVRASALLHERNFGDLRGQPYDTLGFDPLTMDGAPPGGESAAQFAARAQRAFAEMLILHAQGDGDLAVVTHGLLIRVLLAEALHVGAERMIGLQLANTSVSLFDAAPPHTLQLLNCTRHLDAAAGLHARGLSGG